MGHWVHHKTPDQVIKKILNNLIKINSSVYPILFTGFDQLPLNNEAIILPNILVTHTNTHKPFYGTLGFCP